MDHCQFLLDLRFVFVFFSAELAKYGYLPEFSPKQSKVHQSKTAVDFLLLTVQQPSKLLVI